MYTLESSGSLAGNLEKSVYDNRKTLLTNGKDLWIYELVDFLDLLVRSVRDHINIVIYPVFGPFIYDFLFIFTVFMSLYDL